MEQLYYTSCEAGKSINGSSGFQVRAVSKRVAPDRMRSALRYVAYALPPGTVPSESSVRSAPVRLALINTPDAGRLLCHSAYVGQDPVTGRYGNYFSHLLLDVPAAMDAQQAIQSWGSTFWQRAEAGGGTELSEVSELPTTGSLRDEDLGQFLARPRYKEMLHLVLTTLLSSKEDQRIFVAAPAQDVALCVYGITRALPAPILRTLTFSTYESDPLSCYAHLIGTCWEVSSSAPSIDLPSSCYSGTCVGYNSYTGRKTMLQETSRYAEFAVDLLATGEREALEQFLTICTQLEVQESRLLELAFKVQCRASELSQEEVRRALQHPGLLRRITSQLEVMQRIMAWAIDDPVYYKAELPQVVTTLRQHPEVLARLTNILYEWGLAAVQEGKVTRVRNALEELFLTLSPAEAHTLWSKVFHAIVNPERLSWEMRSYLLPRCARQLSSGPEHPLPSALEPWVAVSSEQLDDLLALDVPRSYKLAAYLACLRRDTQLRPHLVRALALHQEQALVLDVVEHLASEPSSDDLAQALFTRVLAEVKNPHDLLGSLLRRQRNLPTVWFQRCVESVLQSGHFNVVQLVGTYGKALAEQLANTPSLEQMTQQLLDNLTSNVLADSNVLGFVQTVSRDPALTSQTRRHVESWLILDAFFKRPSLDQNVLTRVTEIIAAQPLRSRDETCSQTLAAVVKALWASTEPLDSWQALENVLSTLGPLFSGGPVELYRRLLRHWKQDKEFWRRVALLHAFVAIGFGAGRSLTLPQQLGEDGKHDLLDDGIELAANIAKQGGSKTFSAIAARTREWPKGARRNWERWVKFVRPKGLRRFLRALFRVTVLCLLVVLLYL